MSLRALPLSARGRYSEYGMSARARQKPCQRLATQRKGVGQVRAPRDKHCVSTGGCYAWLFDLDGVITDTASVHAAAARGLAGKPAPDTFEEAVRLLGAPPERAVIVEDAISGSRAGCAGEVGRSEADVVVSDLAELDLV
jgi:hypothetical protein